VALKRKADPVQSTLDLEIKRLFFYWFQVFAVGRKTGKNRNSLAKEQASVIQGMTNQSFWR
jgi:hypothetical protein